MTRWGTSMTQAAEHQAPGPTPRSTLDYTASTSGSSSAAPRFKASLPRLSGCHNRVQTAGWADDQDVIIHRSPASTVIDYIPITVVEAPRKLCSSARICSYSWTMGRFLRAFGASRKGIKTGCFAHFFCPFPSSPTHLHTHSYTPFTPTTHPTKPTFNMSDAGRRDLTSQIGSNVKPDSQKSFVEQGKEKLDSLASSAQPESQKSTTQKIGDSVSGNSNENQTSIVDSVKDTLGLGNNNKP
ncbi:hypothetical protein CF319_g4334 [Tilletia indica]|nr:hypothetical protein CF319_g4334 [Tilletia indica]